MQPVQAAMSALVASSRPGSAITSETAKPAAGAKHASRLVDDLALVGGEVDDAVGDDDVDAGVGEGHVLEVALDELDVLDAGVCGVGAGELEHLVGHVEADRLPGRPDAAGGDQYVGAGAGAEIEHGLALAQVGDGCRHATSE